MKILCALAMLLASAETCWAEPGYCVIPLNPSIGRIVPPRVHFHKGLDGCPSEEPRCVLRPYLVRDDVVLLGKTPGSWQCVMYPSGPDGMFAWLPATAVQVLPNAPNPPLEAWVGHWVRDQNASIDIKREGDKLSVHGLAFWHGPNKYEINDGEIGGKKTPSGNTILFDDREPGEDMACIATLTLIGDDLIVQDNSECGGQNVNFIGGYDRKRHR